MHPILASRRRLLLYLAAWIPLAGLVSLVSGTAGRVAWTTAAATLAPACLVYAFVCLSPWYTCRVRPLRWSNAAALAGTHTLAAAAASLILVGTATLAGWFLAKPAPAVPLLFGIGVLLYLLSVGLHYAGLAMEASREAEARAAEARTLAREAELHTLRTQVNPHFLFNSLHSISALATQDGPRARDMCLKLADFLRASLKLGDRDTIPLAEEFSLARGYLELEQIRFGTRLRVETSLDPACEECAIPALLLQPLVENAVKHGVSNLVEGGSVSLIAWRIGADIEVIVENDFDPEGPKRRDLGFGLAQVRRRLEIRHGDAARFQAAPDEAVFRVTLRFPCESPLARSGA